MHTLTLRHTYAHTYTHSHKHTHTHIQTHTHTHTLIRQHVNETTGGRVNKGKRERVLGNVCVGCLRVDYVSPHVSVWGVIDTGWLI